jgi:hypothetical protein
MLCSDLSLIRVKRRSTDLVRLIMMGLFQSAFSMFRLFS